jgi:tetratricopeptide (TPR) repeat protein
VSRLKRLVLEIHRRSLWQVLAIYLGASWAVLEASDQVIDRYLLPEWVYPIEILILLVTFPIVLATAFVREEAPGEKGATVGLELRDPTLLGDSHAGVEVGHGKPIVKYLTWRRTLIGVLIAFGGLALFSASVVIRGVGRVAEASGAAGEAFAERAWLVVAEFEADEEEAEIAEAAQAALLVDLQQSQYVNVYTGNQIAPVLQRMTLPADTPLDERLALEVAEREGLSAVLAAEVNRLGNDFVLSARVIQAGTRDELISVRTAAGADRLLDAVEALSREVRRRLGEERSAIRRSKPLPKVTTRSLEALKKYAQGMEANSRGHTGRALELALEAVRLDSTFAAAYRLAAVANRNMMRFSEGGEQARRAYELRDNLTDRERLLVEASYHWAAEGNPRRSAETYELLLSQYPDDAVAAANLAVMTGNMLGERERAYRAAIRAVELNPYSTMSLGSAISNARWDVADSLIRVGSDRGFADAVVRWWRAQAVGLGDWERADVLCDSLLAEAESPRRSAGDMAYCGPLDIARGRVRRGVERTSAAALAYGRAGRALEFFRYMTSSALGELIAGRPDAARSQIESLIAALPPDSMQELDRHLLRSTLRPILGVAGLPDLADRVAAVYPAVGDTTHWLYRYGEGMSEAALALNEGDPERTVELLRQIRALDVGIWGWTWSIYLMTGLAFADLAEPDSAVKYLEAAIQPAGVASYSFTRVYLPVVERRLAELEESRGNSEAAIRHYSRFLELWSDADPELQGQVESARRALAGLAGSEGT